MPRRICMSAGTWNVSSSSANTNQRALPAWLKACAIAVSSVQHWPAPSRAEPYVFEHRVTRARGPLLPSPSKGQWNSEAHLSLP
eukprot:7377176-Prymnesium_polylepis.3